MRHVSGCRLVAISLSDLFCSIATQTPVATL